MTTPLQVAQNQNRQLAGIEKRLKRLEMLMLVQVYQGMLRRSEERLAAYEARRRIGVPAETYDHTYRLQVEEDQKMLNDALAVYERRLTQDQPETPPCKEMP